MDPLRLAPAIGLIQVHANPLDQQGPSPWEQMLPWHVEASPPMGDYRHCYWCCCSVTWRVRMGLCVLTLPCYRGTNMRNGCYHLRSKKLLKVISRLISKMAGPPSWFSTMLQRFYRGCSQGISMFTLRRHSFLTPFLFCYLPRYCSLPSKQFKQRIVF